MGFGIEGYSRHLSKDGLGEEEHKISGEQRKINLVDIKDVISGIKIATAQWEKDMKDISKVNLNYKNKEVPKVELKKEEQDNLVPFIKDNVGSINRGENQRASGGEER